MESALPIGIRILSGNSLIKRADGLARIRRGKKVLFIEKEVAGWSVLEGAELALFNSLNRPTTVNEILDGPISSISAKEKEKFLVKLHERGLLTVNGSSYYNPARLWEPPQKYPRFLCFHITDACNFTCKYCYARANPDLRKLPKEVSRRAVERILEELPDKNLLIDFHGGEPFMAYEEMVDVIQYAHKYNKDRGTKKKLDFIVQSNGSLVTVEKAKFLNSIGCNIGFSVDGPEFIHDRNRIYPDGSPTFNHIWKNMEALKDADVKIGFLAVIHYPENYIDSFKFFTDQGLTGFRLNYSAYIGRATEELEFPHGRAETFAKHYLEMVDTAIEYSKRTEKRMLIKDLDNQISNIIYKDRPFMCYRSPCGCGNSILGFGRDGGIYACEEATGIDEFRIGNLFDDSKSLTDIVENSPVLKHISGRTVDNIPRCRECTFKRFCGGRCTTKSYARFGNFRREDPMCRFYQIIYPELIWRIHEDPKIVDRLGPMLGPPPPPKQENKLSESIKSRILERTRGCQC